MSEIHAVRAESVLMFRYFLDRNAVGAVMPPRAQAMPRPKLEHPPREHVAVRLDPETIARLDALLPLYALPGRPPTRSDGLRAVVLAGIEVEERRLPARTSPEGSAGG
jgi:hypothetical protein